ncbi:MAG: glycosyltransferase family 4 protein [Bifidobacteriaceae bacterium]|jgi:phosphatidylinositol alpha-1,6-mannosyltransferase|nr:glycosyltransferase family 4 protein [Bifidobacteriaceae bacterium]
MHTLVITNDFPPNTGGIETFVAEMVNQFPPDEVTVLASTRAPFTAEQASRADAALPYQVVRHPARTLWPTRSMARFAAAIARGVQADAIWFGSAAPFALIARELSRRLGGVRIVATTHGHEVWWAAAPGTRQALRRIGDSVDVLTYLTDYTRQRIAKALSPAAAARMARLPGAVCLPAADAVRPPDSVPSAGPHPGAASANQEGAPSVAADAASPAPAPLTPGLPKAELSMPAPAPSPDGAGAREDGPVVLCVSRLVPRKGQDQLIRGWPEVVAAHPGARLVIAGAGPYGAKLRRMAAASPAASSIELTGRVEDARLAELYAAAAVFAMPCRSRLLNLEVEGLGIVYLEASAAGVPVVAGDSGGAPDAVLEGKTGFVVDGRRWQPAAARIIELLDNPAQAAAMGAAGREWVRRDWTWPSRYQTLSALLHPRASG